MSVYLSKIQQRIPQILSLIDREPFSLTCGCGDRVFWCWKFTDFPGARFQEYIYTLAWLYSSNSFENPWFYNPALLSTIEAGFEYWSKIQYGDGSFDEAYPHEHSLAATSFTLFYLTEAFELVKSVLNNNIRNKILESFDKASYWLCKNDERHGFLSNHLSAAAAALFNSGTLLNNDSFKKRSGFFIEKIIDNQSKEGWYNEYGGADIGYQTHGSFYLARIWQKSCDERLLNSLFAASRFMQYFIHPDGSVGGEYSSRNTMFYFPAAYEILSNECSISASIAAFQRENILSDLTVGLVQMDSYNLYPMINNYIFAHEEWVKNKPSELQPQSLPWQTNFIEEFHEAGLIAAGKPGYYCVIGAKKGGVIRIWDKLSHRIVFQSSGYVALQGGKYISSQSQGISTYKIEGARITISAPFVRINQKVFSPALFIAFRAFNLSLGRLRRFSYFIKKLLVRALVSKKIKSQLFLTRKVVIENDNISISDSLNNTEIKVTHIDKFTTFHMGSSRYSHITEEQIRGLGYDKAEIIIDSQGLINKAEVKFDEN